MKLYRLVSEQEYEDLVAKDGFSVAQNTLEVKEFWLSESAARRFLADMARNALMPPYSRLVLVEADDDLVNVPKTYMQLDGHDALVIDSEALQLFNSAITYTVLDL